MAYSAYINETKFFDTSAGIPELLLTNAIVTNPQMFEFTVPKENVYHGQFKELSDYIDVYRSDKMIFCGRVYSIQDTFNNAQVIVCEHISAILGDSIHRPVTYENKTNREVFALLVNNHNSQVEAAKKLTIGRVTVTETACYRAYDILATTSSRINDLVDSYGGHIEIRKEYESGTNKLYIDWLSDYDSGCNQTIEFGQNLIDITRTKNSAEVVTVLIPYGAEDGDGNRLNIKSVNNNKDYVVASAELIAKYGYIYGTYTWDDVTVASNLKAKAEQYIANACADKITINVTAVDLADAGFDFDSFGFGQKLHVIHKAQNIDGWFDCTEQVLNLLYPASNRLTLGILQKGYVTTQRSQYEELKDEINNSKTSLQKAIERNSDLITGNKGGYVVFHDADQDGYPDEILIMDTPSIETARKVWRWNDSGLGYSSTGYDGRFGLCMTIAGEIVADYITSGKLNAEIIKAGILQSQEDGDPNFYLNLANGILKGKFQELCIISDGQEQDITDAKYQIDLEFAKSTSTATAPAAGWSTSTPAYISGEYIWMRNKYTSMKGEVTYSSPACITGFEGEPGSPGEPGEPGAPGAAGKGIKAVETQYAQNQSNTTAPTGSWSTTLPGWLPNYHIWMRYKITYTDNAVTYTTASLAVDLDQTEIFNRLTNNGNLQGIYMSGGKLYINGEYLKASSVKATSIDVANLFAQAITASNLTITGGAVNIDTDANTSKVTLTNNVSGPGTGYKMEVSPNYVRKTLYGNGAMVYRTTLASQGITVEDADGYKAKFQNNVLMVNGENVVDYVIEQGTSGGWSYRKWHSKKYECWKKVTWTSVDVTNAWGYLYEASLGYQTFPVTFKSAPYCVQTPSQCSAGFWLENVGNVDTTSTSRLYAVRATSGTITNLAVDIYACGTVS